MYTPVGTKRIYEPQMATDLEIRSEKVKRRRQKEYKEQGVMTAL
jgi:hypothetical protein